MVKQRQLHEPSMSARRQYALESRLFARRQRIVFLIRGMAHGISDKLISEMIGVSHRGLIAMVSRELQHCKVQNRVQLTFFYIRAGYLTNEILRKKPTHEEGLTLAVQKSE